MFLSRSIQQVITVFCLILTTTITIGQTVKQNKASKPCMSTYSFTVAETDHMKCSHQGASKPSPERATVGPRGGVNDAMVTRRLLAAVHKLVQHNHHLNEAKTAGEMVQKLTENMQHQEDEMKQLIHRMGQLQNQVR